MEVFDGHRALFRPLISPAIALGNFDGFHVGHQTLVKRAVEAAKRLGGDACAYTFEPHPARVLAPELAPPLITTCERKLELLAQSGIDVCVLEPFNPGIAAMSATDFFEEVLVKILGARHICVGYDFTFGNKRGGNTKTLVERAAPHKIEVEVLEPVAVDGCVASSTRVRSLISAGDLAGARLLLGRDFDIDGVVVKGQARGRTLGFPTANIKTSAELEPPLGIYAVRMRLLRGDPRPLWGAASLGTNPTFGKNQRSLEVFVLDFEGDLYDQLVRVEFVERLRGEQRFESEQALIAQMQLDVAAARKILAAKEKSDV